jgi:hypothetical protein
VFQFPKYFIFVFVGLSILTAFAIHRFQNEETFGKRNFASVSSDPSLSENAGMEQKDLSFEDLASCGSQRSQYEESLKEISPIFRDERAQSSSEFSRMCFIYMMKSKIISGNKPSRDFARCAGAKGKPVSGAFIPCVTKNYVNSVYNYFGDVTDCLETPQRAQMPEIFNGSGGHLNALGGELEAGLAQMNSVTIAEANKKFDFFKNQIMTSEKESCQRLVPTLKKMTAAGSAESARCGFVSAPENPFVSILYMNIKYLQDRSLIREKMELENITARMKSLGLSESDYDKENLEQILITLGNNTGASTAVLLLSNYLKRIESLKRKLTVGDFNFGGNLASLQQAVTGMKEPLTFPEYIRSNLRKGSPDYVKNVRNHADQLNREFKEGVCAPDSYLAL